MRVTLAQHLRAIIMGPPGSGKGTVAGRIVAAFPEMQHRSSGDLLRAQIQKGTDLGKEAQTYINEGKAKLIGNKFIGSNRFLVGSRRFGYQAHPC